MAAPSRQIESSAQGPSGPRLKAAVYAATVLLSATLLFAVQPMMGRALLPAFGGSAAVWADCLVFFQSVLLLGYLYAHWSSRRLSARVQAAVHLALLAASCIALPLAPGAVWGQFAAGSPSWGVLGALAASAGLPYLALSATSPLVQSWFAATVDVRFPYRLYALSNAGSLAALIAYPAVIEPLLGMKAQLRGWSAAYVVFAVLCGAAALLAHGRTQSGAKQAVAPERPRAGLVVLWGLFAAAGSMLLVAITNHLCQDVAPAPFLWVLPLALYLLSFILCFDHDGWYRPVLFIVLVPPAIGALLYLFFSAPSMRLAIPVAAASVFVLFMFCNGELAQRRPHAAYLTSFYVAISVGGALGGGFVALAAPALFTSALEFPLALELCGLLALYALFGYESKFALAGFGVLAVAISVLLMETPLGVKNTVTAERNFYGILRVKDEGQTRVLYHGRITHGMQFLDDRRGEPAAYYGPRSGAGFAIGHFAPGTRRIGAVGLGTATIAAYGEPGDFIGFYELNPLVEKLARRYFTFLRDCRAAVEIAPGDARMSLEAQPPQQYDVLILDAFSGDAIPVHLLTLEAFGVYLRHVHPAGVLAVHISNRYLDLGPLVGALARAHGKEALLMARETQAATGEYASHWVLISSDPVFIRRAKAAGASPVEIPQGFRLWTDDYSNLLRLLI